MTHKATDLLALTDNKVFTHTFIHDGQFTANNKTLNIDFTYLLSIFLRAVLCHQSGSTSLSLCVFSHTRRQTVLVNS